MANDIEAIVTSLRDAGQAGRTDDVNQAYATVDRWNRESRTRDLIDLAFAIEASCDALGEARMPYEAVCDHVEEVLALTAGEDHLGALFTLLEKERVKSVQKPRPLEQRVRTFASRLGHGQSKDALLAAIARGAEKKEHVEILACWMHEVVLRGTSLEREEVATRFHAKLEAAGHPLGSMPLTLLPVESEAPSYMPMYGANAISNAVARLETGPTSTRTQPPPPDYTPPVATHVMDAVMDKRLVEAVLPWATSPNGIAEAKIFRLDPAIGRASPGRWLLRALGLQCLEGAKDLRAERVGAEVAFGALFAAAANGGATSSGLGGAYGRRAAWTSLAALVDAPIAAGPASIDARAQATTFLMFGATSSFWRDVAWDIGVFALREGGSSVAVLAASDAD